MLVSREEDEEEEKEEKEPSILDIPDLDTPIPAKTEESQEILLNETDYYVSSDHKEGLSSVYDS